MSEFIDITNKDLGRAVWSMIKEPVKNTYYELYSPWSFYLAAGKQMSIPAGFMAEFDDDIVVEFNNSRDFKYENNIRNGKQIRIKLTALHNICVNEGDKIASLVAYKKGGDA